MTLPSDVPVVVAASASWDTPAPVNAHQIARRLAERGHHVLFVESTGLRAPAPLAAPNEFRRIARRLRGFLQGERSVAPRTHVVSPLALPGGGPLWIRRRSLAWIAWQAARTSRRLSLERPVLWAFLPTALEMARRLRARLVVYHCVDHYAANPGVDSAWIEELEMRMLRRADLVFATSPVLAERLRGARDDVELVPNVADVTLFSRALTEELPEPPELSAAPRPRIVYVGNLASYRVDFDLLRAVARSLPGTSLVLIGVEGLGDLRRSRSRAQLAAEPNVLRLGPRSQPALPSFLRHCDVALIPFLDNDHTRGSLPLKLWEYLAAGLPVVATALPNFGRLAEEGVIRTARGPDAFVRAIGSALEEPPERRAQRLEWARAHDWPEQMDTLCASVGRALEAREASSQAERAPL